MSCVVWRLLLFRCLLAVRCCLLLWLMVCLWLLVVEGCSWLLLLFLFDVNIVLCMVLVDDLVLFVDVCRCLLLLVVAYCCSLLLFVCCFRVVCMYVAFECYELTYVSWYSIVVCCLVLVVGC